MPIQMLIIDQYNKFKKYIIESKIPDGTSTTVYRCGPMVDLCVGPHVPHTGKIKAFMVTKVCFRHSHLDLINDILRTPPRISSEILITSLFNVSMAFLSQTRNNWQNTRLFLPKLPGVITAKLEKSRSSSSSTTLVQEAVSSYPMAHASIMRFLSLCAKNTSSADTKKLCLRICTTANFGRLLDTGRTIGMICLYWTSRRRNGV